MIDKITIIGMIWSFLGLVTYILLNMQMPHSLVNDGHYTSVEQASVELSLFFREKPKYVFMIILGWPITLGSVVNDYLKCRKR